ncbi:MAG: glutamine synthetase family protein [Ktedonobacterales bacterium]
MAAETNGRLDLAALERLVADGQIDTVLSTFPDMQGRLMGKRLTARFFLDHVAREGSHACSYLLGTDVEMNTLPGFTMTSWRTGYHDFKVRPDLATLRPVPWLEKTAIVLGDVINDDGQIVEESPRRVLQRQVERLAALGYTAKVASELEFYLFKETFESARAKHYHDLATYGTYIQDYHILQTTKEEGIVRQIRNHMNAAGIPVEGSKGEWGFGQEELNLEYAEPVEMADRHVLYKHGAKEIAALGGLALTFMAKWDAGQAGSSFHLHSSLWDSNGRAAFFDETRPLGMSEVFHHYLAGQLAYTREMMYCYAPFVNSYKRYREGTFAPIRLVWGHDNRTCGLRVIGEHQSLRVENRVPGADANPYLAFAATIAAGIAGIQQRLELPEMFTGDAYETDLRRNVPQVPGALYEAIRYFEASSLAREAFGERVFAHYLNAAREEQLAYDRAVTCWERDRYFERI